MSDNIRAHQKYFPKGVAGSKSRSQGVLLSGDARGAGEGPHFIPFYPTYILSDATSPDISEIDVI